MNGRKINKAISIVLLTIGVFGGIVFGQVLYDQVLKEAAGYSDCK